MKTSIIVLLLALFAIPVEASTYKWVDNQGNTNYTDDLSNVPQKYRKAARLVGEEENATSPESGEAKGAAKPAAKAKETGETGEKPATEAKEKTKTYGDKSADAWKREFLQLDAEIKANEDQLAELNDRMKDTSNLTRREYQSIKANIKTVENRLQRLKDKRDALTAEANKADVPAELRSQ